MSKTTIPENVKGKELIAFLKSNKKALVDEKKALPIKITEPICFTPDYYNLQEGKVNKTAIAAIPEDANSFRVKVVANACWWCDSQYDVLVDDCAKDSIKQRKAFIKHLRDHEYKLAAEVGDVQDIYMQNVSLVDLGINEKGTTQCIIFETNIRKDYDPITFDKYKSGKINQHSIGLQYVRIDMAIYDPEDEKEMDFWNKYIDRIINKDWVAEQGFFFVVSEIKLLENSAVLFGSNQLTPTLDVSESTKQQPVSATVVAPQKKADAYDWQKAITETTFIHI